MTDVKSKMEQVNEDWEKHLINYEEEGTIDLQKAKTILDQYEEHHMYGKAQGKYEGEDDQEDDTAHNIATEDLIQDTFYCQWRIVKENIETNPLKAYFALYKMHGDHGDCDNGAKYARLKLEDVPSLDAREILL